MKTLFAPIILAIALVSGCATHQTTQAPPSDKFMLMDSGTQHSIAADALRETRLPDGRLDVAANVHNRESRRIQVQVNCEFKDAQGYTIDSTPWQTLVLTENGQEMVRFASMKSDASGYTIRIRQAR
ncbi:MAG TPA: YcfL family protein [Candidatus Binatia bacterium]|nr:YcfL family protein [Candidatus Binatia bacterium]